LSLKSIGIKCIAENTSTTQDWMSHQMATTSAMIK